MSLKTENRKCFDCNVNVRMQIFLTDCETINWIEQKGMN